MNTYNELTKDQQTLVEKHVGFAMNMGIRFRGRGVSVEDLQQEACLGLCEAALRYDMTKEVDFQTYAYNYCLKFIMSALRHEGNAPVVTDDGEVLTIYNEAEEDYFNGTSLGEMEGCKVELLLASLSSIECRIISMVYGINTKDPSNPSEPMGLKAIAAKMKLPVIRVKQLYASAIDKMKQVH